MPYGRNFRGAVNDLPRVIAMQQCCGRESNPDLLIASPAPYHYTTEPHKIIFFGAQLMKIQGKYEGSIIILYNSII